MKVTLIARGIVLPMEGRKMVHAVGSVLVGDNTILAVGPADEVAADPRAAGADVVDAAGRRAV